jgi:FtsP/CotA-like multicopper oxidase with cupredoxin domain
MTRFEPNKFGAGIARLYSTVATLAVLLLTTTANAGLGEELVTTDINLTASEGYISVADGASVYSWGYSNDEEAMQLPGPTLIVTASPTSFKVTLTNNLPAAAGNVSIVFPGLTVNSVGGVQGDLAQEATPGNTVTYNVTATEPGTYQYHSGTQPDLQVEMGLYGALVVKPAMAATGCTASAYDHAGTCFDREYLFLLSEIDIDIHQAAEMQAGGAAPIILPAGPYHSEYWLMNGRAAPDTLAAPGRALLPHQPYNIIPRMHPGEKLLLRVVGAGRELHPFHTHGNHARVLARDGRMLVSESNSADLAGPLLFTIPSIPGGTVDAVFEWTGKDLGWDVYGHTDSEDLTTLAPEEWAPDHGKPIPVDLPSLSSLAFGGFYSGSPFLGAMGALPPGEGGLNPNSGFTYMWHSHNERELVNNDVFPGGMMTMLIIEAPGIPITN